MTSAADFSREPIVVPKKAPKKSGLGDALRALTQPRSKPMFSKDFDLSFFALVTSTVLVFGYSFWGIWDNSACHTKGRVAGADKYDDIDWSLDGTCIARVEGRWIEVK